MFRKVVNTLNERIKMVRNALGLTQQEFADRIKVKRNTVATYEMGRSTPSYSAIALICNEFNVNEEWLRNGTGKMFKSRTREQEIGAFANQVMDMEDDAFVKRFVEALTKLDAKDWECIERISAKLLDSK